MHINPGTRIRVMEGDGSTPMGYGTYEGDVTVYFIGMPDGSIRSLSNAEEQPSEEALKEIGGTEIIKDEGNPKIKLDDNRVVYGCQVWWEPLSEKACTCKTITGAHYAKCTCGSTNAIHLSSCTLCPLCPVKYQVKSGRKEPSLN